MNVLDRLTLTIEQRREADPEKSYVAGLHQKGLDAVLKKVGEETAEVLLAAKNGETGQVVRETADLWFHLLVMLAQFDLRYDDVLAELERRFGCSGIEEKANRKS